MSNKTKSLKEWCIENEKEYLLDELDSKENEKRYVKGYIPNEIEYNSSSCINWECKNGHKYSCEIVGRTLFNLGCPKCNPENDILPVNTKYGCLTIVDDFSAYQHEIAANKIKKYEEAKENLLLGIKNKYSNIDSPDVYDELITDEKNRKLYKCQCKCGKIHYKSKSDFLKSKHRYCTRKISFKDFLRASESDKNKYLIQYCKTAVTELKKNFANCNRIYDNNYEINYSGKLFESLEILNCVDDKLEKLSSYSDLRKPETVTLSVYKLYKCKCYLCGKEMEFDCSQFQIQPPTSFGYHAYHGYWSDAHCDCHEIPSFQWIVNKLLLKNNISYKVEYTFPGLYGFYGKKLLQFDFCIFDKNNEIKALIECQGEQHYESVEEFGGEKALHMQEKNDKLKRKYVEEHNIKLIEIPYTMKKIEEIENILKENDIL